MGQTIVFVDSCTDVAVQQYSMSFDGVTDDNSKAYKNIFLYGVNFSKIANIYKYATKKFFCYNNCKAKGF